MAVYVSLPVNLVVVVSNIFYFHPDPWGYDSQFDEHIFQVGWFNHQLVWPFTLHLGRFWG